MNCMNHPDKPAVTTCTKCATGMCPECVEAGLTQDSKALCARCAPGTLREALSALKSQCWRSKLKFFLSAAVMCIGLVYAAAMMLFDDDPGKNVNALLTVLLFFGFAGVISVIKREDMNSSGNFHLFLVASGNAGTSLTFGFMSLAVAFVLGIIYAPVNLYRYFVSYRTCEKTIGEYTQLLSKFTA